MRKNVEDCLISDILDEVMAGLCAKLASRAIQEAKRQDAKDKEEAGIYWHIYFVSNLNHKNFKQKQKRKLKESRLLQQKRRKRFKKGKLEENFASWKARKYQKRW
jgi:hypothetical protein